MRVMLSSSQESPTDDGACSRRNRATLTGLRPRPRTSCAIMARPSNARCSPGICGNPMLTDCDTYNGGSSERRAPVPRAVYTSWAIVELACDSHVSFELIVQF